MLNELCVEPDECLIKDNCENCTGIGPLIGPDFWQLDVESRDLNMTSIAKPRVSGEAMREKDSDDCLTELFGTTYVRSCRMLAPLVKL